MELGAVIAPISAEKSADAMNKSGGGTATRGAQIRVPAESRLRGAGSESGNRVLGGPSFHAKFWGSKRECKWHDCRRSVAARW